RAPRRLSRLHQMSRGDTGRQAGARACSCRCRDRRRSRRASPGILAATRAIVPDVKILVVDVGGTNVKVHAPGHPEPIKIPSGDGLTPAKMVKAVLEAVRDCRFDVVSIGYPGVVVRSKAVTEPVNLGRGWVNFNFRKAFGRPVRM